MYNKQKQRFFSALNLSTNKSFFSVCELISFCFSCKENWKKWDWIYNNVFIARKSPIEMNWLLETSKSKELERTSRSASHCFSYGQKTRPVLSFPFVFAIIFFWSVTIFYYLCWLMTKPKRLAEEVSCRVDWPKATSQRSLKFTPFSGIKIP